MSDYSSIHAGDIVEHPLGYKALVLTEPAGKALTAKVMVLEVPPNHEKKPTCVWILLGFSVVVEGS